MIGNVSTRSDEITALLAARGPLGLDVLARLVNVTPAMLRRHLEEHPTRQTFGLLLRAQHRYSDQFSLDYYFSVLLNLRFFWAQWDYSVTEPRRQGSGFCPGLSAYAGGLRSLWSSLRPGGVSPVVHGYKSEQKSSILHRLFKIVAAINFCFYSTHRARGRKLRRDHRRGAAPYY